MAGDGAAILKARLTDVQTAIDACERALAFPSVAGETEQVIRQQIGYLGSVAAQLEKCLEEIAALRGAGHLRANPRPMIVLPLDEEVQ